MIIVSKFWTNLFSFGRANAVTIFPIIFLKYGFFRADEQLIRHERIHLRQALELGIVFFYLWYLGEFVVRFARFRDFDRAYRNISFEREAYRHENDPGYLSRRKVWTFWNHL
ncbi:MULTISPECIES: hypothetical protein [unclassified Sphingobacterium]|uniref:hypothetical protein n=1 Tax=unclassified Sphingobacterium TaxID=2609468 RepID=UPI0025E38114|nr:MULTISPECIES: hypothetical protein [unclassified Sphingobacterium]